MHGGRRGRNVAGLSATAFVAIGAWAAAVRAGSPCSNVDVVLRDTTTISTAVSFSVHNPLVIGNRVYASWYQAGLRIMDIDEDNAEFVEVDDFDTFPGAVGGFNGAWGTYPFLGNDRILISDLATGLYIAELTGPPGSETLSQIGHWDLDFDSEYADVWGDGDVAYVAQFGDAGVHFIDISNPASPVSITEWRVPSPNASCSAQDVKVANGLLFISLESNPGPDSVEIVDVRDPFNPAHLTWIDSPGIGTIHNSYYDGGYLYLADSSTPVITVIDLTAYDPDNPPASITQNKWLLNVGSSFVHDMTAIDGLLYACAWNSGLWVYDITDVANTPPVFLGSGAGSSTHAVWPSANGRWAVVGEERSAGPTKLYEIIPTTPLTPVVSYPNGLVSQVHADDGATLVASVGPACIETIPATATLFVMNSIDGPPFEAVPMTWLGGNAFEGEFPSVPCDSAVSYYFSVEQMGGGTILDPPGAPGATYSASVYTSFVTTLTDEFEAASGWTVGDVGDNATSGTWTRVNPNGTAAQPEDDHTTDPATMCFVTGQGSVGGGVGEADVDNGKTTLISPTINLSGGDALIGYWRWFSNNQGGAPNEDAFTVDIRNNAGGPWVNVETVGPTGAEVGGGWFHHEFIVGDFVTPTATVQLRFVAVDNGGGSVVEAAVDDFLVQTVECMANNLCSDGILNQDEQRIDCGGVCAPCECLADATCVDAVFCDGDETCDAFGQCAASGADPCPGQACDEGGMTCADCLVDDDCDDDDVCTADTCTAQTCSSVAALFGDVNRDGTVDIFDILCVLDGFSGVFTECSAVAVDIAPCVADGVIDIFDILAVLDAFGGDDPCCGG